MDENILSDGQVEISLRLSTHGAYTWSIRIVGRKDDTDYLVNKLKETDNRLKDTFPDYSKKGSGRIADFEKE